MTDFQFTTLNVEGHIGWLTLTRAKQLNALNHRVMEELHEHLAVLSSHPEVRTVILRGEGRAFAAGADIAEMVDLRVAEAEYFSRQGQDVFAEFEALPQPTVALIQGYALGGGLELAMACDLRIAAEGAKFGQPEVTIGVLPGFAGSQRLPRLIGQGRALHLLLTGDSIDAETALSYGLVTQVVPETELEAAGRTLAEKFSALPKSALALVKRAVYEGDSMDLRHGAAHEAALFGLAFSTADRQEGMRAFVERRKPEFRGE